MPDYQRIFLGLGSNMGKRLKNLKQGMCSIHNHPHIWVTQFSHVYQSKAMYQPDQDDFYNMVLEIDTNLSPLELLTEIKKIEQLHGRTENNGINMPRLLDVDILAFGDLEMKSQLLYIPHPRLYERNFVLKPWKDIAPEFVLPDSDKTIEYLYLNSIDDSKLKMILALDLELKE